VLEVKILNPKKIQKPTNNLSPAKIDTLYPNDPFTSNNLYHDWIHKVRSTTLPYHQLDKEKVLYTLVWNSHHYQSGVVFRMKHVESIGYTVMSCFPLHQEVMPKYVPIGNTTLCTFISPTRWEEGRDTYKGKFDDKSSQAMEPVL